MTLSVRTEFQLACGRRLTGVPADHPCARDHGHTFRVTVVCEGPLDPRTGFVVDFAEIQRAWAPIDDALDHRFLNDIPGLENPTSERLAFWIFERLRPALPSLAELQIGETGNSSVRYRPD
ncbi:MAG: 6-carboxytetrahydropterin synthase [Gemmatimonadaceae bacterium]|nr:6-carboxytetrahydropterin synthase [Gemmatimonadaceae bacterium]